MDHHSYEAWKHECQRSLMASHARRHEEDHINCWPQRLLTAALIILIGLAVAGLLISLAYVPV